MCLSLAILFTSYCRLSEYFSEFLSIRELNLTGKALSLFQMEKPKTREVTNRIWRPLCVLSTIHTLRRTEDKRATHKAWYCIT